jgi:hypothetical protein
MDSNSIITIAVCGFVVLIFVFIIIFTFIKHKYIPLRKLRKEQKKRRRK